MLDIRYLIHHLFNPHCDECKDEKEEAQVCKTCEVLQRQLDIVNEQNRRLMNAALNRDEVTPEPVNNEPPFIVRGGRRIPLAVKRQMLEAEDRVKASILATKEKEIKDSTVNTSLKVEIGELEKAVGIDNAS